MILSEKLVEVISVGTPLTSPVACFERAGKGSCLTSTGDIFHEGLGIGVLRVLYGEYGFVYLVVMLLLSSL